MKLLFKIFLGLIVVALLAPLIPRSYDTQKSTSKLNIEEEKAKREQARKEREANCRNIRNCWIRRHKDMAYNFLPAITNQAKYQYRWEKGMKFASFGWDEKTGHIQAIGGSISFQNGFGAWQPHTYMLTFDPVSKHVVDVVVKPGRLPN